MSQEVQALLVIGLVTAALVAVLVVLYRSSEAARAAPAGAAPKDPAVEAAAEAPARRAPAAGASGGGVVPLLEVVLMRLGVPTADALRGRLAASPDPTLLGATAVPIDATEPVL